jgi:hypothetical protein
MTNDGPLLSFQLVSPLTFLEVAKLGMLGSVRVPRTLHV